ncbi:MAG: tol-pal system protein YbgF [Azonexus sp.]|nr:tol-pal system protein YbgF [Azonexus sp.]MCK6413823.1 tol-pal system protein YbgF [Azonexus sp.]
MRPHRIAPRIGGLLFSGLFALQAQAGIFDDDEARRQIGDLKMKTEAQFDQQARAKLDLAGQIQLQAEEISRLRGLIETLTYELDLAKKRQQDFYLDLDTRLRKFETAAAAPAAENGESTPAAALVDPAREGQEYEAALNAFKAGKYKDAASAFAAFAQKYPDGQLAPNAQFWLGNAWYAQRDCKRAIEAQTVVTTRYADSPKAADAWLALATCQHELGQAAVARRSLETLVAKYPKSPAAEAAHQRLKKK